MIAFGVGVWLMAGQNVALRITAGLIMGNAVISLVAEAFFPLSHAEGMGTSTGTANVIIMALGVVLFLLAMDDTILQCRPTPGASHQTPGKERC